VISGTPAKSAGLLDLMIALADESIPSAATRRRRMVEDVADRARSQSLDWTYPSP